MEPRLIVCTTCRHSDEEPVDAEGRTGGQRLLDLIEAVVATQGADGLRVEQQACLWACASRCSVYLSGQDKPGYLAGRFTPTPEDAQAIVDFARLYAASLDGAVAYRDWPEGIKGHFIARLPAVERA